MQLTVGFFQPVISRETREWVSHRLAQAGVTADFRAGVSPNLSQGAAQPDLILASPHSEDRLSPAGYRLAAILPRAPHRYGLFGLSAEVNLENFSRTLVVGATDPLAAALQHVYCPHFQPYTGPVLPDTAAALLHTGELHGMIAPICEAEGYGIRSFLLQTLPAAVFSPAPGQGITALFTRQDFSLPGTLRDTLHHPVTETAWTCESAFAAHLRESAVSEPVFALATPAAHTLTLMAGYVHNREAISHTQSTETSDPLLLARMVALDILSTSATQRNIHQL